jgi:hypothetical protein
MRDLNVRSNELKLPKEIFMLLEITMLREISLTEKCEYCINMQYSMSGI